jgi:putative transposase
MALASGHHTRYELKYHFVWCPKYRRMVLKGNRAKYLAKLIYEVAERYDFDIVELAVMPDHVHMFVSASPEMSPASIVQTVKSITARKMFLRFPGIKKMLWGGALWVRGYFVMSSGTGTTDEMIRKYIKEQRKPMSANDQPNLFGSKIHRACSVVV